MTIEELRHELLRKVHAAAVDVCEWDWSDIDAEPKESMEKLKAAVAAIENLDDVQSFAQE